MRVHPLAPVVGIDIDGTLGDYHNHFVWFINHIYWPSNGTGYFPHWGATAIPGEFSDALHLPKNMYRDAKLAYRLGGLKRCLPLFDVDVEKQGPSAISQEIQYLRSQGIQVWICTQRPWLALTTVDNDTQYWIEKNVGEIDGLIYGQDKYADLIDIVGKDRILGVIDDLPECIERAQELGLQTAIRRGDHNAWWRRPMMGEMDADSVAFSRVKDMSTIIDYWMENYNG